MRLPIEGLRGVIPRVEPQLLPEGFAVLADNVDLRGGGLRSFSGRTLIRGLNPGGDVKTAFLYDNAYWLNWTEDADVHAGPIAADIHKRLWWTEENGAYPKKGTFNEITGGNPDGVLPLSNRKMGVPAPTTIPTLVDDGGGSASAVETRIYVFTYVSDLGEESGPSPQSAEIIVNIDDDVTVTFNDSAALPDAVYGFNATTWGRRLYRLVTGTDGAVFLFIAEVTGTGTATKQDTVLAADLGAAIPSFYTIEDTVITWEEPPDGLKGLTPMAGGSFAGFVGKTVYFSEQNRPWAWPSAYARELDSPCVGLRAAGFTLYAMTEGYPHTFIGEHPFFLSKERVPRRQACVSKRSIQEVLGGVVYASPDGLMRLAGSDGQLMTEPLFARSEWQDLTPSSILAVLHDGKYYFWYETPTGKQAGYIMDPTAGEGLQATSLSDFATAAFSDLPTDRLYLASSSGELRAWNDDATSPLSYDWRSRTFVLPRPWGFSAARIEGSFGAAATEAEQAAFDVLVAAIRAYNASLLVEPFLSNDPGAVNGIEINGLPLGGSGHQEPPAALAGQVALRIYAGGQLVFSQAIVDTEPVRLPDDWPGGLSGRLMAREWEVRVTGTVPIRRIILGNSRSECG